MRRTISIGWTLCGCAFAVACSVDMPRESRAAAVAAANEAASRATTVATDGQVFSGRDFYFWNPINAAPSTYEYHAVLEGIVSLPPHGPQ
jgi:hypothetical protein